MLIVIICLALGLGTLGLYAPVRDFEFVNYDDDSYVYENPVVEKGLTLAGIRSAFAHSDLYLWTPLTRISHMLDVQLFGLKPGGHHLMNVLLHTISAVLLFLLLHGMTGRVWSSAFVSAIFAIHPLHVESVAWISERKDVLSGVFFMLTLYAYERYVRNPRSLVRYLRVIVLYALGLLSKPMLVTLPFILLLLDYWPLQRYAQRSRAERRWLILEKIPLLALSGVSLCLALLDPFSWNEPRSAVSGHSLSLRIANAVVSYALYIRQMIYPNDLAVRYPFPTSVPIWEIILSLAFLGGISAWVYASRRDRPYLLVGWLWYVGMLVPVIGVIELGGEAHSDRYTYLPQIGLYLLATCAVMDVSASWRWHREILGIGAVMVITSLIWRARVQTSYWHDNESLWAHAIAVTSNNNVAHNNLGKALLDEGNVDDAIKHFQEAVQIQSNDALALSNLGVAMTLAGNPKEGIVYTLEAVRLKPASPFAQNSLGFVFLRAGDTEQAIAHCTEAIRLKPDSAGAHGNLGSALLAQGKVADALIQFREALRLKPNSSAALNNLAWLLATRRDERFRNGSEALALAKRAAEQSQNSEPSVLDTLAAALAENGRFDEAITTATQARTLALSRGDQELAAHVGERLELYKRGLSYRK